MRVNNQFFSIIKKYLRRDESISERKDLYSWYETLEVSSKPLSKNKIIKLHQLGKKRLFNELGGKLLTKAIISPIWYRVAAAVLVIVTAYFSINYFMHRSDLIAINVADIEKIAPAYGKATITLSSGEAVTLDTLGDLESTELGSTTISNNGSGELVYTAKNNEVAEHTISTLQTARASQYNIKLSDGTHVWVNAKSQLSFPQKFGNGDRIVKLTGEAYFEVKKTKEKRKFIVESNGQTIEVLGTKFNVNGYQPKRIKTTLAEGSVRITPTNKSIKPILLKPNQQSILSATSIQQQAIDASRITAWKDGYFSFDGNNTKEILEEIGDWYGIDVQYNNQAKAAKYTGKIPKSISLSKLVMLLGYQDIAVKAFKDKNNQLKLIVN